MSEEQGANLNQISSQMVSDSIAYNSNANVIRMRLDTDPIIRKWQSDMLGIEIVSNTNENGELIETLVRKSPPILNEIGVTALTSRLRLLVNQHNFQGNLTTDQFNQLMGYCVIEIADDLLILEDVWGLSPNNLGFVANSLFGQYYVSMTRPIDNLERPSLENVSRQSANMQNNANQKTGWIQKIIGG